MNERGDFFSRILTMFTNVLHLKFYQSYAISYVSFNNRTPRFSSTLVELHIHVYFFDDCLYLLDGRLNQLRALFVNVFHIFHLQSITGSGEKLINLKHFSLTSGSETFVYDEVLVPHLCRMSNLETLALYILIECRERFIDGYNLTNDIVSHMLRLNQFKFDIRSIILFDNEVHLPSNEDIQRSLTCFPDHEVISCVDYFPNSKRSLCRVYTYPYSLIYYDDISNNFPGGLFRNVQTARLFDERAFEHMFFVRIAQAFPYLRNLTLSNQEPPKYKENEELIDNRCFPIIEYPHLIKLHLLDIHDDYTEQFLLHTKTCFPNLIYLIIQYGALQRVTHNFTRDATRVNCDQVKKIHMHKQLELPKHFFSYFLHASLF